LFLFLQFTATQAMSYIALFVLLLATTAAVHASEHEHAVSLPRDSPTFVWEKCVDVPVLGNCCLALFAFPNNLTVLAEVTVGGFTLFKEELTGTAICADDVTLLQLIDKIPALLPFKPLILALIAIHKFIPADVFHVCLLTKNLTITRSSISGCSSLDVLLMCFDSDCLYKGNVSLGCFDIPFPASEELPSSNQDEPLLKPFPDRLHQKQAPQREHPGMGALRDMAATHAEGRAQRGAKRTNRN